MTSLIDMEGFMGVDKDGAPIMAATIKPMVMPERAALTVHEILETVTPEPPGPTVPAGRTAKHPAGPGGLVQNEFESNPVDVQRSVATFRLPNPGKVFRYTTPQYLASFIHLKVQIMSLLFKLSKTKIKGPGLS